MKVTHTVESLRAFEEQVCADFASKRIRAPVHLDHGNERQLIEIFGRHVDESDWVTGSWRQHYKALLKGVSPDALRAEILAGHSISLCFPSHKIISSAIVGGMLPIAVGLAMAIKLRSDANKVVCFMGEMTYRTGIAHECIAYSTNFNLPILFVVEDNGKSVCTPTYETWGLARRTDRFGVHDLAANVLAYQYESRFPHAGTGKRIEF